METAAGKDTLPTKPKRRWGDISVGALGVGLGLVAVGIEVCRNYEFGLARGEAVAATYVLFGLGLAVTPAIAQRTGWTPMLRVLLGACFLVTAFCGISYYSTAIVERANQVRTAAAEYRDARAEIDAASRERTKAEAEASAIGELVSVDELAGMVAQADTTAMQMDAEAAREAGNQFCGNRCRGYQDKADSARKLALTARERLGQAKAKAAARARAEAAGTRLAKARADAKAGAVTAAPLAHLVADQVGGNADAVGNVLDLAEPLVMVIGMLFFAALIDRSLSTLAKGLGMQRQAAEVAKVEAKVARIARPALKAVRRPLSDDELMTKFAGEAFTDTPSMTGAQVYELFEAFWIAHAPGRTIPSNVMLSKALVASGITRERKGKTIYTAAAVN